MPGGARDCCKLGRDMPIILPSPPHSSRSEVCHSAHAGGSGTEAGIWRCSAQGILLCRAATMPGATSPATKRAEETLSVFKKVALQMNGSNFWVGVGPPVPWPKAGETGLNQD